MKTNCGCVYMLITEYLGDIQFSRMVFRVCKQKQTRTFVKSLLITRCFFQLHYACCHILHHHYTICHGILLHPCCNFNVRVHSVPDVLLHFISAGGGLRMEVEQRNPRVESKTHRRRGQTGEAPAAFVDYKLSKK